MRFDTTFQEQTFKGRCFEEEIERCVFTSCCLEEIDLSELLIVDTIFEGCDLRMAKLDGARLQGVRFVDCRLTGTVFTACSEFALDIALEECDLTFVSFVEMNLSNTSLKGSKLEGADFTGADLSGASLSKCDLLDARFERTNLEKADLRGAANFDIDPDSNRITGAKFDRNSLEGLLRRHSLRLS